MGLKLGSLFDGIGSFPLAATMHAKAAELGIGHSEVLAVSERLDVEILREMRCEDEATK